jgi:hypothetical protein
MGYLFDDGQGQLTPSEMRVVAHRVAPPSTAPSTTGSMTGDIIRIPKRITSTTTRKQRYKVSHLPLPAGVSQSWKSVFIPPLLAWAGSQKNPWGLNDTLCAEILHIWGRVYSEYPLRDADIHIVMKVVRLSP